MRDTFRMPEEISGEKIIIKRRSHKYDEELFNLITDSADVLRKIWSWVDFYKSIEDMRTTTEKFSKSWDNGTSFEYIIIDKPTNKIVGAGGVVSIDSENKSADLGYLLHKDATGNGYVTEFVQLLEKELFKQGIHRITIRCQEDNRPSANVARRCGYKLEGILHDARYMDGEYRNIMLWAKTAAN